MLSLSLPYNESTESNGPIVCEAFSVIFVLGGYVGQVFGSWMMRSMG